ncbi:MAG: hypothetical protein ABS30_03540 [OM182 bacterium BACL3 MAG-120924-bin41]|uniref:VOC domain-containing protein n=1 Tax=OM182 bacterium BACL3 MAG-120924-bin41 TaxID=1655632 RepID=A0A0R2X3V6_9GAMM|nr:MAG: hypothetical protein ABS30_03540 [OM182 bacterium BACL3 MAG-120924-bin41]
MRNFLQLVCAPLRLGCLFGLYFFSMNFVHAQPQQNLPALALVGYQAFALRVSDIDRSVRFYSDVFGAAPVRDAKRATYALGTSNQHFILSEAEGDEPLGFAWIGLGVRNFDRQAVSQELSQLGFSPIEAQEQRPLTRAMRFWSDEKWGQDALFFADAEGIVYRVMSTDDCGACAPQRVLRGCFRRRALTTLLILWPTTSVAIACSSKASASVYSLIRARLRQLLALAMACNF